MTAGSRSPYGDELAAWARICDDLPDICDRATQFNREEKLKALLERTRRGDRKLVLWDMLLGELAALAGDARFMTWRDPDQVAGAWPSSLDPDRTGFVCPGDLCNRRAAPSPGARPRCALLDCAMTGLGSEDR